MIDYFCILAMIWLMNVMLVVNLMPPYYCAWMPICTRYTNNDFDRMSQSLKTSSWLMTNFDHLVIRDYFFTEKNIIKDMKVWFREHRPNFNPLRVWAWTFRLGFRYAIDCAMLNSIKCLYMVHFKFKFNITQNIWINCTLIFFPDVLMVGNPGLLAD